VRHPLPEKSASQPVPAWADDTEHGRNIAEGHSIGNVSIPGIGVLMPWQQCFGPADDGT
jgi:hypothetical protein